jgi:hypothetical protein
MKLVNRKRRMDRKILQYLIEGFSQRGICRQLHVGRERVLRVKRKGLKFGYIQGTCPIPPFPAILWPDDQDKRSERVSECSKALEPWIEDIEQQLESGMHAVTVFEFLLDKKVGISRSALYRFLKKKGLLRHESRRVIPEIIHDPGECLQLDWGKLTEYFDPIQEKLKIIWMLVAVLGHSRYTMVRLVETNSVELTVEALTSMFSELGGVPERVTSDNPKCLALLASRYEAVLNPQLERFASHYQFRLECLPPADPQKKGKVERMMPYIRRLFEGYGEWTTLEQAQEYLNAKLESANARIHGTTRRQPNVVFHEEERPCLKPLPAVAYEYEEIREVKVRQDGHVRFDSKFYSVDETLIGQEVLVIATKSQLSIFQDGKPFEVHQRIPETSPKSKSTKQHHLKPWERSMKDSSIYLQRARDIGPHCEMQVRKILDISEDFIDLRKVWGILSLNKKYSHSQIEDACQRATAADEYGYRSVLAHLDASSLEVMASSTKTSANKPYKFVRPMSVYSQAECSAS